MSEYPRHGRARSWVGVAVIVAGFTAGGVALTLGPTWWLFWTSLGVVIVGGIGALFSNILADVVLDEPRDISESMHYSIFGQQTEQEEQELRGGPYGERTEKPTTSDPADWPHG